MTWNVFIVGLDDLGEHLLADLRHAKDYSFHGLLPLDVAVHAREYRFDELLDRAIRELEAFEGSIDAVVGYWDFPTSGLLPLIRRHFGLPGPTAEAIAKCEHKYWSRLEQNKVVPGNVPDVAIFDPFDSDVPGKIDLDYPFWIKPVKAHSSHLGFRIDDEAALHDALPVIRRKMGRMSKPFAEFMVHVNAPEEIADVEHKSFLAESIISDGAQCTLEGYGRGAEIFTTGIVDTERDATYRSVLSRYVYPSRLPESVQKRIMSITESVMSHIGYNDAPFNIEFYYDKRNDRIRLLEINSRLSRSHAALFQLVDGAPHFQTMVDLGIGIKPRMPHREGRYPIAAKQMMRVFRNGVVRRVPSEQEVRELEAEFPGTVIEINVEKGMRLSDLLHQDEFSYELGVIFTGAIDQEQLEERVRYCEAKLRIEVDYDPD